MKHKKIFRILAVTLTLALLLVAIPTSVVLAVTTISVENIEGTETTNPYYGEAAGEVEDTVQISGSGTAGTELHICLSNQNAAVDDYIDEDVTTYEWVADPLVNLLLGTYSVTFDIPEALKDGDDDLDELYGGTYYFYVTAGTSMKIVAKAEFYVAGIADAEIDETEGPVGTQVEITGEGFAPGEEIAVWFDNDDITDDYVLEGDIEVDEDGEFSILLEIPEEEYGEHDLVVTGTVSLSEIAFIFAIEPEITLTLVSGEAGSQALVNGTGFDGRNYIDIYIGSTFIMKTDNRTNSYGSFSQQITIPAGLAEATYTILAEDEDDDDIYAEAEFTVIVVIPPLDPVITVSPTSGNVGAEVDVSGEEFTPDDEVTVYFDDVSIDTVATLTDGSFTGFSFDITECVSGSHTIKAEDTDDVVATATITVEPEIAIDLEEGSPGTEVTVTGTGFGYRSDIAVEFDSTDADIESGDDRSGDYGSFEFSFIVPAVGAGKYDVTVEDEDGNSVEVEFTVVAATVSITPTSGVGGTEITVTGANFIPGATVTIKYDGTSVATTTVGSDGAVSAEFDALPSAGGAHTVTISDGTNSPPAAEFTITAEASITPTSGNVGSTITVNGAGFSASKAITITYDGSAITPAAAIVTLADGIFTGSFTAPVSTGGSHTITLSDGTTIKTFTFTMETTAPAIPQQSLPYGSSKPTQPVTFDWADVTDASMPVTYSLQVATDAAYGNLVINKTGLTDSEYTLTDAEKLDSVSKDSPYYWRVKATDAASNSSDWGPNGTFYVGTTWPGWLMWLWIGLGALVLGVFFFWLGRRIAFSSY